MARKRRGRGEGGISQRKDGRWCGSVSVGHDAKGKRKRQWVYGKTKGEVQKKLRQLDKNGAVADAGVITVTDYLDRWLNNTVKQNAAPTTHKRYEQVVRLHVVPYIGHVRLSKLAPLHIEQLFVQQEKNNVSARNRQMSGTALHTALSSAVRLKLIPYNVCSDIQKPRITKREMQAWTLEESQIFLKEAEDDRLHALYVVAIATGLRQGELFALSWPDFDDDTGDLFVQRTLEEISGKLRLKETKTAKGRRRIALPRFAIDALLVHRKRMLTEGNIKGPIFCDTWGGFLRKSNFIRGSYKPLVKRAGVSAIRFHDLRHTAATLLLLQGEHPKVVSERLGHASIEITLNTYSRVLPTMQKEAAKKLDKLFG